MDRVSPSRTLYDFLKTFDRLLLWGIAAVSLTCCLYNFCTAESDHARPVLNGKAAHPADRITNSPLLASLTSLPAQTAVQERFPIQEEIERLLAILKDRSASLASRQAAADTLGKLREKSAREEFTKIANDISEPLMLRYKAVRGLGGLGDDRPVPTLKAILTEPTSDRHLRVVSALALGNIASDASVAALQSAGKDPDDLIRFKVVQALGRVHNETARLLVEQAISDPDAQVQTRAIRSLGELGEKSTVATLARILHSSDDDFLKIACLTALGSINEPVSVSALQPFEQATNELLRRNAHAALARSTQKEKARK